MKRGTDEISEAILNFIKKASEPIETKEVELALKEYTRTVIFYRLLNLRADALIKGKQIGSGKGTWIWWFEYAKNRGRK